MKVVDDILVGDAPPANDDGANGSMQYNHHPFYVIFNIVGN